MRKRAKKLLALLTAVTVTVTGVNVPAAQAAKVSVKASKTTLYYNGTSAQKKATITVKNAKKKVTYSISKADKKIVKLSKTSGKKITVTAKKKGTAKVTVKVGGKKVKTVKFTVKKKSTATPKPTVAPTQAPTQEPSQEPTVAPSDEPTVAPTDAPSDAPTATPSEEPTKAPEKSVVTEIKILNDVALTNGAAKAYVYYDVLDQYGKSMRESCSINWSTSPAQCTADKQTGRLTITNTQDFKYGDYIVITGVHAQSGVSVSKTLTAGLQQQIDTINFEGFVKDNEKNKLLETVGADFDKGTSDYYLAFTAKDQNGNDYEFTNATDANDVTFTSDNPLLLSVKSDTAKLFTISDKTYVGVKVAPGMYADKGGEVNITAISNKTGGKVTKNFVIGSAGVLASLELLAPTTDVCDGESVELKYVAKDTAGNEITNYETIIRSTNSLTLNVSEGELKISENNDGTAKVTWSDVDYDATATATYGKSVVSDGIARPISVSTVVIGGSNSFMQFQVNDIRIPVAASIEDQTVTSKSEVQYKACYADYDGNIAFTDQYGKALSNKKATAFLQYARTNKFGGSNGAYYSLSIKSDATQFSKVYGSDTWMGAQYQKDNTYFGQDWFMYGIYFNAIEVTTPNDVATATFKASIVKCDADTFTGNTLESVGKIDSAVVTVVPLNLINTFEVSATSKTLRLAPNGAFDAVTTGSATYKVNAPMTVAGDNGDNAKVSVIGKYKGTSLAIADAYLQYRNDVLTVAGGKITGVTANQVSKSQAFDLKTANEYGATAQEFSLDLNVKVDAQQTGAFVADTVQDLSKSVTFKYEDQVATAVSFGANATPGRTNIGSVVAWSGVSDQFGNKMDGQDIVYSVTNIKENTGDLAHVADSFVVEGNGSAAVSIKGAEVGDEFDVVATVKGTKVTSTVHVTVTADSYANITATKTGVTDNDKILRRDLKYTR